MTKILFVEDNKKYRTTIEKVLKEAGYAVDSASGPMEGLELFTMNNKDYDLVISDLVMEEIDGIKFLAFVKKITPEIKTMILTAEPSAETELASLDIYVDKYLVKETKIEVILRHIQVLLAQPKILSKSNQVLKSDIEGIVLDPSAFEVLKNGEPVSLTLKEFQILKLLLENKGAALSREQILDEVWDTNHETVDVRVIDVHIKAIRRKLTLQSLLAIRGYGYKWDE